MSWSKSCDNIVQPVLPRIAAAAIACLVFYGSIGSAQDGEVTFAGYQFDPLQLEQAAEGQLDELLTGLQIDESLRASQPTADDVAHWRVLQFSGPVDREARNKLKEPDPGLKLDRFSGGVYVERVSLETVALLKSDYDLLASIPYHPAFKLGSTLRDSALLETREFQMERRQNISGLLLRAETFGIAAIEEVARMIASEGGLDVFEQASSRPGVGGRLIFRLAGGIRADTESLARIAHIEDVRSIEEVGEFLIQNVETASANQSGDRNNPSIWNQELTGNDQVLSIFDSGVPEIQHCFFNDPNVTGNTPGPSHRKLEEVRDQSTVYLHGFGHATFVAGSAAGDDYGNPEQHDQRGGAWSAKLVIVNIFDFFELTYVDETGNAMAQLPPSTLYDELIASSKKAHIYSNSWQESPSGYSHFAEDFDYFSKLNEEHLVVAAAGRQNLKWGAPAIAKNALTVSAAAADGSSIGNGYNYYPPSKRRKPDLAAVGCQVRSAKTGGLGCEITSARGCATSYAAPHTAATAALVRQFYIERISEDQTVNPTSSLIKATLINSARDVPGEAGFPSQREGWGVVTLDRTLKFSEFAHKLWFKDVRSTDGKALDNGDLYEHKVTIASESDPLKVTLVWVDSPGVTGDGSLVNDLDLKVISPDGLLVYQGNHFDTNIGVSVTGGSSDNMNNVEQVLVDNPATGEWTIQVAAAEINVVEDGLMGQGYALVATGDFRQLRAPMPPNILINRFVGDDVDPRDNQEVASKFRATDARW